MKAKGVRYYCASCRQREAGFLRGTQVVTRTNTQEHQFLLSGYTLQIQSLSDCQTS